MQDFPRVSVPADPQTAEQAEVWREVVERFKGYRALRASAALALYRMGHQPHVKPPAHVIAKRRAKNKVARRSRRDNRLSAR